MNIEDKYGWIKHMDFIVLDMIAISIAYVCAYIVKFHDFNFMYDESWHMLLVIVLICDLLVTFVMNPYSGILRRYGSEETINGLVFTLVNLVISCVVLYALKLGSAYSRTVLFLMYIIYFFVSVSLRVFWKKMLLLWMVNTYALKVKPMLVVSSSKDIENTIKNIKTEGFSEYEIKGLCVTDEEVGTCHAEYVNMTSLDDMAEFAVKNGISQIFVGINPTDIKKDAYARLVDNGIGIHVDMDSIIGVSTEGQCVSNVGKCKTLSVGVYTFTGRQIAYLTLKRFMDIVFGVIGCVSIIPIALVVKISYLATGDTKSIFYTQARVGKNGKVFKMVKFRSMVSNADEILKEMLTKDEYRKEWNEHQKFTNDPRITLIGKILRKTSLDEIPQFINVLKGDMSLVGPRPLVVGELESHGGLRIYNQVEPGITGWWGCNGRSCTSYKERLELEYYYVKNCSLYLDMLCILKTVVAVLKREGAE